MKSKKIKLCGKNVGILYCIATEIAYNKMSGSTIDEFTMSMQPQEKGEVQPPDLEKIMTLIYAAVMAYSQAKNEEPAISMNELLTGTGSDEIPKAMFEVLNLRNEWYYIPPQMAEDDKALKPEKETKKKKTHKRLRLVRDSRRRERIPTKGISV